MYFWFGSCLNPRIRLGVLPYFQLLTFTSPAFFWFKNGECVLIFHMYRYYAAIFTFVHIHSTAHVILYTFSRFDFCLIVHVYCYNSVRNGVVWRVPWKTLVSLVLPFNILTSTCLILSLEISLLIASPRFWCFNEEEKPRLHVALCVVVINPVLCQCRIYIGTSWFYELSAFSSSTTKCSGQSACYKTTWKRDFHHFQQYGVHSNVCIQWFSRPNFRLHVLLWIIIIIMLNTVYGEKFRDILRIKSILPVTGMVDLQCTPWRHDHHIKESADYATLKWFLCTIILSALLVISLDNATVIMQVSKWNVAKQIGHYNNYNTRNSSAERLYPFSSRQFTNHNGKWLSFEVVCRAYVKLVTSRKGKVDFMNRHGFKAWSRRVTLPSMYTPQPGMFSLCDSSVVANCARCIGCIGGTSPQLIPPGPDPSSTADFRRERCTGYIC